MANYNWFNKNLRILNFTHVDFDGATSNIVLKNYFNNVITYTVNYGKEKDMIARIKQHINEIDGIIITDFCPNNLSEIQSMSKPVLVIDHHESAISFHNPKNDVFIVPSHCGAYLTYKFFNKFEELLHLQELVEITNDYDLFILKNVKSRPFNTLFWKMGFEWFVERFIKGNVALYSEEKEYIKKEMLAYKEFYKNLEISDLPNQGVFAKVDKYLSDVSISLKEDGYKYLILYHNGQISLRSSDLTINLVNVCNRIGKGGGHRLAAGVQLGNDTLSETIKKIVKAVDEEIKANS